MRVIKKRSLRVMKMLPSPRLGFSSSTSLAKLFSRQAFCPYSTKKKKEDIHRDLESHLHKRVSHYSKMCDMIHKDV